MIECKLLNGNPKTVRLQIRGHAGTAPKGEDVVCAGVSALWCTLVTVAQERGWQGTILNGEGDCEMEIALNKKNRSEVFLCLGVIISGLKMFTRLFPEYVSYREDAGKNTDILRAKEEE